MTYNTPEIAFAIFGSAARGDNDTFSDRDLLMVSDDEMALRLLKARYNSAGWSCTAYSWSRLQRAANQGSLFVQHLKQESRILTDPSNQLAHLLYQYSPKSNYKREFDDTSSLIGNLTQHMPLCDEGPMWAADVLSVGFRSLAVARLADEGIYAFSNDEIIDGLAYIGMAKERDGHFLRSLRRFKSLYRRGVIDERVTWLVTYNWIRTMDSVFSLGLNPHRIGTIDMVEVALANSTGSRSQSNWYARCRRIESALWMLQIRHKADQSEFQKQRQSLFGIVKSPNSYAWHFTGGYESVQGKLSRLVEMCAV